MKIVLLGYMGSGKTTVGKHIAESLDVQFLDLDDYIEKKEEMPIPTIFQSRGELYFRKKEYHYLEKILSQKDSFVLSVGGGTPCYGKNLGSILESTENVFYLNVPISQLAARLSNQKSQRPLIRDISDEDLPEFIGKHLFERNAYYNQAHITLYCGNKSAKAVAAEILHILNPE